MATLFYTAGAKIKIIMKNILKNITVFFKKKEHSAEERSYRNPYRDWMIIFVVSALLLIVTFALNLYVFFGIQKGTLFSESEEAIALVKNVSTQKLDKALQLILSREKIFEELKTKKTVISDPSM